MPTVPPLVIAHRGACGYRPEHTLDAFRGTSLVRRELVERAAARGLDVWAWTLRPENRFLPAGYWSAGGPARFGRCAAYWRRLAASGIAGVFADHPDLARATLGRAEPVGARA